MLNDSSGVSVYILRQLKGGTLTDRPSIFQFFRHIVNMTSKGSGLRALRVVAVSVLGFRVWDGGVALILDSWPETPSSQKRLP